MKASFQGTHRAKGIILVWVRAYATDPLSERHVEERTFLGF
jgi:hypothetical protein